MEISLGELRQLIREVLSEDSSGTAAYNPHTIGMMGGEDIYTQGYRGKGGFFSGIFNDVAGPKLTIKDIAMKLGLHPQDPAVLAAAARMARMAEREAEQAQSKWENPHPKKQTIHHNPKLPKSSTTSVPAPKAPVIKTTKPKKV